MRKKSHIFLAQYLVNDIKTNQLMNHRKAFYLGSILPDCKPSFLTMRHEFTGTIDMIQNRITKLTEEERKYEKSDRVFARQLGEVIHFIADYFTFPHNDVYYGSLKDHCYYEKDLKFGLKRYISQYKTSPVAKKETKDGFKPFHCVQELVDFVKTAHAEYLNMKHDIESDCRYIVRICRQVVEGILHLKDMNNKALFVAA